MQDERSGTLLALLLTFSPIVSPLSSALGGDRAKVASEAKRTVLPCGCSTPLDSFRIPPAEGRGKVKGGESGRSREKEEEGGA